MQAGEWVQIHVGLAKNDLRGRNPTWAVVGVCVGGRGTVYTHVLGEDAQCSPLSKGTCLWEKSPALSSVLQAMYGPLNIENNPQGFVISFYKLFIVVSSNLSSILVDLI